MNNARRREELLRTPKTDPTETGQLRGEGVIVDLANELGSAGSIRDNAIREADSEEHVDVEFRQGQRLPT